MRLRPLAFATFLVWRLRIGACGVGACGFWRLWQLPVQFRVKGKVWEAAVFCMVRLGWATCSVWALNLVACPPFLVKALLPEKTRPTYSPFKNEKILPDERNGVIARVACPRGFRITWLLHGSPVGRLPGRGRPMAVVRVAVIGVALVDPGRVPRRRPGGRRRCGGPRVGRLPRRPRSGGGGPGGGQRVETGVVCPLPLLARTYSKKTKSTT